MTIKCHGANVGCCMYFFFRKCVLMAHVWATAVEKACVIVYSMCLCWWSAAFEHFVRVQHVLSTECHLGKHHVSSKIECHWPMRRYNPKRQMFTRKCLGNFPWIERNERGGSDVMYESKGLHIVELSFKLCTRREGTRED